MGSPRGAAAKGGNLPPKASGGATSLGFPTLGSEGAQGGAPAHQGLVPLPLQHMGPSRMGGPTRWTPGTLPVVPVQYQRPPKLSRWPKLDFLYTILHLRTILQLLLMSEISSGTPNNFRVIAY